MPPPVKSRILPTLPPFHTFPPCFPADMICSPKPFLPTPIPTQSPTATTTPQPTRTPSPTPFTFFDPIDCRNSGPSFPPTSASLACFGKGRIPKNIGGKVKLVGKPADPQYTCYGFPESETEVSFTRFDDVDWTSGTFLWTNGSFETTLRFFIFTPDMIRSNPNIPNLPDAYHFENSIDADNTGSCSYDPATGKTTLNLSGTSIFGAQGSSTEKCTLSFEVKYEGTGDPVPPPFSCAPTKTPIPTRPPPTPTPTKPPTPTPTPSSTMTPTPSPSISPTPTPTPSPT